MKMLLSGVIIAIVFSLPAFALDTQKLDMDTAVIGIFLQRIVNPEEQYYESESVAIHCKGYGIVVTFSICFECEDCDQQFSQDNEELTRKLSLYLAGIRQLNKGEKTVVAIKNSDEPHQVYIIQAQNKDLISFQQSKIKLKYLSRRIKISKDAFAEK